MPIIILLFLIPAVFFILCSLYFSWLIFGTFYPLYRSYKAFYSKNASDYVKCVISWVSYSVITIILGPLPTLFNLVLPILLSQLLYKKVVRPVIVDHEQELDAVLEQFKAELPGKEVFGYLFSLSNLFSLRFPVIVLGFIVRNVMRFIKMIIAATRFGTDEKIVLVSESQEFRTRRSCDNVDFQHTSVSVKQRICSTGPENEPFD